MKCRLIKLPEFKDNRGILTFFEGFSHIPFEIKRVFFVYGVPLNAIRGKHVLKKTQEFMIAVAGSFDVLTDDGKEKKKFHLNKPSEGLFVPAKIWIEVNNFSINSVCAVFASEFYDPKDYMRSYELFRKKRGIFD